MIVYSAHAVQRMVQRGVSEADVRAVLDANDIIESYPTDTPYPSVLLLGDAQGRPLHVVAAHDAAGGRTIVITVYEPDPALWDATFRNRVTSS